MRRLPASTSILAAYLLASGPLFAQVYTEPSTSDAGETIATAQGTASASSPAGQPLTTIRGTLSNADDVDLYEIILTSPSTFSATTNNDVTNSTGLDTELFLFDSSGHAIAANDDDQSGSTLASTIPAGNSLTASLAAGVYYIGVSVSEDEPTNGPPPNQLLFQQAADTTTVRGPATGVNPTTLGAFDHDEYYDPGTASYEIDLTGTAAAGTGGAAVPSDTPLPGWSLLVLGAGLVGAARHSLRLRAS